MIKVIFVLNPLSFLATGEVTMKIRKESKQKLNFFTGEGPQIASTYKAQVWSCLVWKFMEILFGDSP